LLVSTRLPLHGAGVLQYKRLPLIGIMLSDGSLQMKRAETCARQTKKVDLLQHNIELKNKENRNGL
jgi:hypothetical protein